MLWLHNYTVRLLAVAFQVSLPTLSFCFYLLIPSSDPSHCFLTQRRGTERSGHGERGWNYFCGDAWLLEKIKWFKGLCREEGTKRSLLGRQEGAEWYNATWFSFSFSWPRCLLRIGRRAQGRRQDWTPRHALVGEEGRRETCFSWDSCWCREVVFL